MSKRSEKRKRTVSFTVRCTPREAAKIRRDADHAGKAVASLLREAALGTPPISRTDAARLCATLGAMAQALRDATQAGDNLALTKQIEATHRDIADISHDCFTALGRQR